MKKINPDYCWEDKNCEQKDTLSNLFPLLFSERQIFSADDRQLGLKVLKYLFFSSCIQVDELVQIISNFDTAFTLLKSIGIKTCIKLNLVESFP